MARTGLRMMPTFPSSPLRFRTAGFPRYGSKAGLSDGAFPCGLRPSFAACVAGIVLALSRGCTALLRCRHASGMTALPQRPSLRSGLCCPGPSSLNRPHPSHWPTRYHFPALRVIGPAFAVLACCQPRHSTTGSELSLHVPSQHVALFFPGESRLARSQPSSNEFRLRLPLPEARHSHCSTSIRFVWVCFSGLSGSLIRYNLLSCSPPWRT